MESIEAALNEGLDPTKTPESQMAAHQVRERGDRDGWRCGVVCDGERERSKVQITFKVVLIKWHTENLSCGRDKADKKQV